MCAPRTIVPGGKPVTGTEKAAVPPPVTVPAALRGTVSVIVATPRALASTLVTGGTSFAALNCAVNGIGPVFDGVVGVSSSPQPASIISADTNGPIPKDTVHRGRRPNPELLRDRTTRTAAIRLMSRPVLSGPLKP